MRCCLPAACFIRLAPQRYRKYSTLSSLQLQLLLATVRGFTSVYPYGTYPTAIARALFIVQARIPCSVTPVVSDCCGVQGT